MNHEEKVINVDFSNTPLRNKKINPKSPKYGIIESTEGDTMENKETYTKEVIDLKFEKLEERIDHKFDNMLVSFENMLLKNNEHLENKMSDNKKWIIGTVVAGVSTIIALIGVLVSVIPTILGNR